ncbi:MAG: hypothetical protein MUQ56_01915 [Thermoleophilia bacterium]|nr:hypothetical protein [Thermoleophilia bacterium]
MSRASVRGAAVRRSADVLEIGKGHLFDDGAVNDALRQGHSESFGGAGLESSRE